MHRIQALQENDKNKSNSRRTILRVEMLGRMEIVLRRRENAEYLGAHGRHCGKALHHTKKSGLTVEAMRAYSLLIF